MSAPYVIAASMIGCAFGWLLVPWASDVLLHRVRDRADAWWAESLEAYRAFKRDHPEDEPSSSASGTEGAVGIWRDEAFVAGLAGSLTEERLQALAAAGFKVGGLEAAGTADERRRRYSFEPRPRSRMLCAAALGTAFAVVATIVPGVPAAAMLGICASAMAVSVVCDLRARVIPLEACGLVAVAGTAFQLLACGPAGAAAGLGTALFVAAGSALANRLLGARCPGGAVGRGDVRCMGALSLATGAGARCGFAACYTLAGLAALAGCAVGKLKLGDGMPMAPFLSAWLACGAAVGAAWA